MVRKPPLALKELGIMTHDRASVNQSQPVMAGPHAEDLLRKVRCLHLVIRETAHLDFTPTCLDPFHFGATVYVSQEEALSLLHEMWHQPMDPQTPHSGFRPVIYMSFGANHGISKMRKPAFDFDPTAIDTTVATLDAQIKSQQTKITRHADATLAYLIPQFKIPCHHPENSGNPAMCATIVAVLSALRFELYSAIDNAAAKPGRTGQSSSKAAADVVQGLMGWPTPAPPVGVSVYCWRCGSIEHAFVACGNGDLRCARCEEAVQAWRRENAGTHTEGLCSFRRGSG